MKKFGNKCFAIGLRYIMVVVLLFAICLSSAITTAVVMADDKMTSDTLQFYGENNILFYDPNSTCISPTASPIAKGAEAFAGLADTQVGFVEKYHDIAVQHSINYGIPWEAVIAQGILESASGTSRFAVERNNFFGLNAVDSNPDLAYSYKTPAEGWEGYYKFIQGNPRYRKNGVFSGDAVTNPYAYITVLKAAGYASDPNYIKKVSDFIAAIEALSKDRGWESSAELAKKYPEWYENAAANSEGLLSGGGAVSGEEVGLCSYDPNVVAGELKSGGMTLEEAIEFMKAYREEASKKRSGNMYFLGALVEDVGSSQGTLNNCSAFTQWFVNKYTTIGPDKAPLRQGSCVVSRISPLCNSSYDQFTGLEYGGKVPRVYAIMSRGSYDGNNSDGWGNHTGIVLGIDVENDKIIIGEASWNQFDSKFPGANEYSLSEYTNATSQYGPRYLYTDNVLKGM